MRKVQVDVDGSGADSSVSIRFLDDTQPLMVKYDKQTTGLQLFDRVCAHLQLLERGYFGLRYDADDGERYWLDALRTVHKQLKNVYMKVLNFRVRYYPANPSVLAEGITRYYLFLQLRRDLLRGRLLCLSADAIELAALIVQSEMGDYDTECPADYMNEFMLLPRQNAKQSERISERHKELRGVLPAEAELRFLQRASTLDTYGVDPFVVQCTTAIERTRRQAEDAVPNALLQPTFIGAHHRGVVVYCSAKPTILYRWSDVANITYESKFVHVHLHGQPTFASLAAATSSPSSHSSTLDRDIGTDRSTNGGGDFVGESVSSSKRRVHTYKCETGAASRAFWLIAVDQRAFFTLTRGADAPRMISGSRVPLLSRHSKFRFSGRSERELLEESKRITREQPSFLRTPSTRIARDVQAKRHSSLSNVAVASEQPIPTMNLTIDAPPSRVETFNASLQPAGAGQHPASPSTAQPVGIGDAYVYDTYARLSMNTDVSGTPSPIQVNLNTNGIDYRRSNGGPALKSPEFFVDETVVKRDVSAAAVAATRPDDLAVQQPWADPNANLQANANTNVNTNENNNVKTAQQTAAKQKIGRSDGCSFSRAVILAIVLALFAVVLVVFEESVTVSGPLAHMRSELRANVFVHTVDERVYQPVRRMLFALVSSAQR